VLTVKRIAKLQTPGRYRAGDPPGLYLQITGDGGRSWLLRYERAGREHMLGLGSLRAVDLKEARRRAKEAHTLLFDGKDPVAERKKVKAAAALEEARAITFAAAARQYAAQHQASWKNPKHRAQFLSTMEAYAFPVLGRLAVADIGIGEVLRVIEPIWNTKTETASRVRGRVERVLDWCQARGLRAGDNPARWAALKTVPPEYRPAA
jgi:hypothetical protein